MIKAIKTILNGLVSFMRTNRPNWAQNDPEALDYIKNRPFYSEPKNVTVENVADSGVGLNGFPVFAIGDTVTVNVDGVEYSLVAYDDEGYVTIGDTTSSLDNGEGQFGWQIYVDDSDEVRFYATEAHTVSYLDIENPIIHKIDEKYLPDTSPSFKPAGKSYLTFSSSSSFTLKVDNSTKRWDGTLEYFASDKTWTVWDGTTVLSAVYDDGEYFLYLRGTKNTIITGSNASFRWILHGSNIACIGNIENLLDYTIVESGNHPTMADYCYSHMFYECTSLTQAPALPATTLADYCYSYMFDHCTSLTQAPALPATTLAKGCYSSMFYSCDILTQAPALPATTMASVCYQYMFCGCAALTQAPALPATTLAASCYSSMFQFCTALTQAPALPATTLAYSCYQRMFDHCTALTQAPALPATTLAERCYSYMFDNCTSLTQAPALPATTMANRCYSYMFEYCTALTQAPALPATTLADYCYQRMFSVCTHLTQVPALPATKLANYCYSYMFDDCQRIKLSSTKTDEYTQEYRIPSSGEGVTATDALDGMFIGTGGTLKRNLSINKTYYLSSDDMIVRKTDIVTLNGYIRSMIDNAGECIPAPATAEVGQVLAVKAVDADGKPTEWEVVVPMVISSSTEGSTKKFKIAVDDSGTITATEVTA